MHRQHLEQLLTTWLAPGDFSDSAVNGLQVEGRAQIGRVVCGVSANLALISAAIEQGADAVIAHHGLIWANGIRQVSGWLGRRLARLMRADVNLLAYHLPLDAHPRLGNNAGLADAIGLGQRRVPFGAYKGHKIGFAGPLEQPRELAGVVEQASSQVGRPVQVFGDLNSSVASVAVCSGGAADLFTQAVDEGVDLYVTGEPAEWTKAVAQETGVAFMALGHHATERFGVQRLADELAKEGGLTASFIDIDNPV